VPGLDRFNRERKEKLSFAELVWKAKWEEEQKARAAQRAEAQAEGLKAHGAFASIEYALSNNEVYRASLKTAVQASALASTCVFILVGIVVGLIGTGMRLGIEFIEEARFDLIFEECEAWNATKPWNATEACTRTLKQWAAPNGGAFVFFGVAALLIIVSGCLVAYIAPAAAASGLPEVRTPPPHASA